MRTTILILVALSAGCSFTQLSDKGSAVAQLNPADATNCDELGVVTASTTARVVINRSRDQVAEDLIVLARNEAAGLGANAIVAVSEPENGTQRFRAYRCN